jgi:hypothetical protein
MNLKIKILEMKESLKIAKEQLINRWIKAFDEIGEINLVASRTVKIKYAEASRFDLHDYNNGRVKQGGKLFDKKPDDKSDYHEYGLDQTGFPTVTKFRHSWNKIDWIGYYKREESFVEYIEFCLNTKVPSAINRIIFEKGKKSSFQFLKINGGASYFHVSTKEEIVKDILNSETFLMFSIQEYEYENNLITKAFGLANTPGIGEFTFNDFYNYNGEKELLEIKRYFEKWPVQIEYIKPSGRSMTVLLKELAELFVKYIINILLRNDTKDRLCFLVLSYHYCDDFWPSLEIVTEETREQALNDDMDYLLLNNEIYENITSKTESPKLLKKDFKEFTQRMEAFDNYNWGRRFLIQISKILTQNKLEGLIPVTDDFVVFPIDWTLTEDIGEILIKCGAKKSKVKEWKVLNWF